MPIEPELFQTITTVLQRDGIPQGNRQVADVINQVTGQDIFHHLSGDRVLIEDFGAMRDAYAEHRRTRRMATFGNHIETIENGMYIGRDSNTQSSRWWSMIYDTMGQMGRLLRTEEGRPISQMPFVVSEQNRFDRNPMGVSDPQPHAMIQLLNLPDMVRVDDPSGQTTTLRDLHPVRLNATEGNQGSALYFDIERYDDVTRDTIADLVTEGWELVHRTFNLRDDQGNNTEVELTVGAVHPTDRYAVMLFNVNHYLYAAQICVEILLELYSRIPELEEVVPSEDSLTTLTLINQARAAVAGIRQNITSLQGTVRARENELEGLLRSVANQTRNLHDERRQLNELEVGTERVALQTVMDLARIPNMVNEMRQVQSAEITTENDSMWLEIITYPFGMRVPPGIYRANEHYDTVRDNGSILYVVPARIRINLMGSSWSESIVVTARDDARRWHPHVAGRPCWGQAATPLAESWGRRDWESFVRILLGWITQYDSGDIYTYIHHIINDRGQAPRTGWLTPDENGVIPGPVTEAETIVEANADEIALIEDQEARFVPIEF